MIKDITQDEWVEMIENDKDAVILDVRTDDEVAEGYIPGMINYDIHGGQEFMDQLNTLDKSKNYYVYCRSGARSGQACQIMDQNGFANAYNLIGGFMNWDGDIEE
ncbi:rhodanese-like domain-containing protein [Aquimarina sp. ERC-38]|uniref:rhodanese-like domain-containing protein n=1 Tax=Aquimarina sp. ERC-38 TaxID=2949996 RepID=UPI0022482011|nr:rhodanese-like domain-containing protein [Aquimarina sp. ERC-38]UZO79284.1 rhodanese-like domain-containing protein [Aquimarina sp. ERC-38]